MSQNITAVKLSGLALLASLLCACTNYQSHVDSDGDRLFVVNNYTGAVTIVEGNERFTPATRGPRTSDDSATARGAGTIPNSRFSYSITSMWANDAARIMLTVGDTTQEPDTFRTAFGSSVSTYQVGCSNIAGFRIAQSERLPTGSFTGIVNSDGQQTSFEQQTVLPLTYDEYERVSSCTISWVGTP